jgi:hypothetical protein
VVGTVMSIHKGKGSPKQESVQAAVGLRFVHVVLRNPSVGSSPRPESAAAREVVVRPV